MFVSPASRFATGARRSLSPFKAAMLALSLSLGSVPAVIAPAPAAAQEVSAFMQAVAEAASSSKTLSEYYRATGYKPIFADNSARAKARRQALLRAVQAAPEKGLAPYDTTLLEANLRAIKSDRDLGRAEVAMAKLFLDYARDIQTGQLVPSRIDSGLVRQVPYRDALQTLTNFVKSSPAAYLRQLEPTSPEYARLLKEKAKLERVLGQGGWGQEVPGKKYEPGQSGNGVIILRNRLMAMGYLPRSATTSYDAKMQKAVQLFQMQHGLTADGVAGPSTIEELNVSPEKRLASILVALERERWINMPLGKRHIWVNLTDFSAKIVDSGRVTFETRSVVGMNQSDRRSPEFSDEMEHMVINPTWNVPRSIAVKEYLPMMKKNPNAAGHLRLVDSRGRTVNRANVDFSQYTTSSFPFALKQPPSNRNALGLVKFMFPNKYNIYLHDTPSKSLFGREVRAFSHGCIRLQQPFDFAYALLAKQTNDPVGVFQAHLKTGQESVIELEQHVPVHLVYRTAVTQPKGGMEYRRDIYGRDAKIWAALQKSGVQLRAIGG
ncbi:L,D-transpeptidase family protein [Celeribacter neptunius]|uniref:Murein L,D-transpeptidase YcbB/YkuD n=1 Tax=Celeribacter neptunius TaxID=588602 RepID=A0A1I3LBX5_9RHOB|nr:L,D-transpeptidase family protein [Celeribacter neptunius]SFI81996.1 Murein L,D-transpeptidase YcbB/YkuD [Celeribacter neptunius]